MSYLKKLIKSLKVVFITTFLSYFIIIIAGIIYYQLGYQDIDKFINTCAPYVILIYSLLTIIFLLKKYPRKEPTIKKKQYFPLIALGISLAITLNMIIFKIIPPTSTTTNIPLILSIITSGLIGPIYEEVIFRYVFLNKLKTFNSPKVAILINSIIFALIHLTLIKMIYAFILGIILNLSYHKTSNILAPILIHISANIIVLFLHEYNTYIFLLSIISLLLSIKINYLKKGAVEKLNN